MLIFSYANIIIDPVVSRLYYKKENSQGANLEGAIIYEDIFCIDKDLLIYEEIKMVFKEYGWKVEIQVKEKNNR